MLYYAEQAIRPLCVLAQAMHERGRWRNRSLGRFA